MFSVSVEVIADVVEWEDPPVAPEIFSIGKKVLFMSRNSNGNGAFSSFVIALALIPVMMSVENPVDLSDSKARKVI
jgi:hypothetical protein